MRVGVLGSGRMGAFRAKALSQHPDVDEVLVGSRRQGTIDEVLEADLDAIVVSTATGEHASQIARAAARRLPILCEKPIALTLRETRTAIDAADQAGVPLQVAFQRRFDPEFRRARELVRSGALGALYTIRMNAYDHEPSPEHYVPTSGGIYKDLHVHDFDMARWLTGLEVAEVYATGSVRKWERFGRHGDVDTAAMVLTMADGTLVLVAGTRHDPRGYDFRAEVLGSEGFVTMGPPPLENPYRGFLERFAEAFRAETDAFVALAQGKGENPCPGLEALEALRVAVACDRSRAEGRPVRLGEVTGDA